ncbi:hypothetical protein ROHU_024823 [Labeo rohita]|uniref:Uncharacterized protein n=1 Tax=Labeo rohita TaxID=84645 RepID=A0A498MHX9_LABRO|nr:hypothetical protein ROHU_024823 [Labeo rohita]
MRWMGLDLGCCVALNDRVPLTHTKPTKLPSALPSPPDLDNAADHDKIQFSGEQLSLVFRESTIIGSAHNFHL